MDTNDFKGLVEALDSIRNQQTYNDIVSIINERVLDLQKDRDRMHSSSTAEIAKAFAAAQGEYPTYIGPNRDGFFLKSVYTDIPALRKALFPILAKHGLSFRQHTQRTKDGSMELVSTLSHSSGEYYKSRDTIVPENATLRSLGTTTKYIRRHQMMALLQCDPFEDADDDNGEHEHKDNADIPLSKQSMHQDIDLKKHSYLTVTPDQIDQIETELDGWPDLAKSFFKAFEIARVADLRRSLYDEAFKRLLTIKRELSKNK